MTEQPQKPSAKAATPAPKAKKRTIYSPKGMLELPDWAKQDKEHKYRWVSNRRASRSDGFDPRGWSVAKDPEGHTLTAADVVLHRMPVDEFEAMKEYKRERAISAIGTVLEGIESASDRLRYEVERLGGKMTTDFTIERKSS